MDAQTYFRPSYAGVGTKVRAALDFAVVVHD
jgi:hypothetical protein